MATAENFTTETLTFIGRRPQAGKTKPAYVFLDGNGKELWYPKAGRASVIGGRYAVEVARDEDGGVSALLTTAVFLDRHGDSDEVALWEVADRNTERDRQIAALERKVKSDSELQRALAPLRRIAAKARSRNEVDALVAIARQELTEAWYSR